MTRMFLILAALLAWPVTSFAQSTTKLCFPTSTATGAVSCQDVRATNPLPVTGVNINVGSLNISALNAVSVTVTNTAAVPVFVSNPNGLGGGGTSAVTQGTNPWIVSSPNTFNTNITNNPLNVTQGNGTFRVSQASSPWLISTPNTVNMNIVGGATLSVSTVTVTNQGAGSQLNVLDTNSAAMLAAIQSSIPAGTAAIGTVTVTNNAANPAAVTCTNCGSISLGSALNVTVTNVVGSPVLSQSVPGTTNGWTTALLPTLSNTPSSVKTSAGKVAKIYCYNQNAAVTFVQVFNAQPGSVTIGTTSPMNSYGIPATSASGFSSSIGDTFSTALSLAATTTVSGLSAPSSTLQCNVSYN